MLVKLKIFIYIILLFIGGFFSYKIYYKYQYLLKLTNQDLVLLINQQSHSKVLIKIDNIQLNYDSVWLYFNVNNVLLQSKINNKTLKIGSLSGRINILSLLISNSVKISEIIANNIDFNNNIITLYGSASLVTANPNIWEIDLLLADSNQNLEFNINTILDSETMEFHKFNLVNSSQDIREVIKYLPDYLIDPKILQWLTQSLLSGKIIKSEFLWVPKKDFSWLINFSNITLKYAADWPPITNLDATMKINENSFTIKQNNTSNFSLVNDLQIKKISANWINNSPIKVNVEFMAPINKILKIFASAKIKIANNYLKLLSSNQNNQKIKVNTQINIPLEENENINFSGKIKLRNKFDLQFWLDKGNLQITSGDWIKTKILIDNYSEIIGIHDLQILNNYLGTVKILKSEDNPKQINLENDIGKLAVIVNNNELRLNGSIDSKLFKFNDKLLQQGPGIINFNLQWPDYFKTGLALKYALGKINIDIINGTLIGVNPGIGKLISLLNIDNLQRRLSLDFSDVTGPGFSFDQLKGQLLLEQDKVKVNHITITGPAAKMAITGDALLSSKTLDLFVEVSNPIDGTVSLAAAVAAGNPIVGAAIWLFNKTSNIKVGELKIKKYKVIGTLEQPEIIEL